MKTRNYPIERKQAPTWECPVCHKIISSRGRVGHMERVHGRGMPVKGYDPFPWLKRTIGQKRRPLSRGDVRNLVLNIYYLLTTAMSETDIVGIRRAMFQCEYLIRELEINGKCSLEEAWVKFRIPRNEIYLSKNQ